MILQGRFNSVFTPHSLRALSAYNNHNHNHNNNNKAAHHYYYEDDEYPSAKTVSIEHRCDKNYVG